MDLQLNHGLGGDEAMLDEAAPYIQRQ